MRTARVSAVTLVLVATAGCISVTREVPRPAAVSGRCEVTCPRPAETRASISCLEPLLASCRCEPQARATCEEPASTPKGKSPMPGRAKAT